MTDLVALTAIVATVAIVALIVGRPFRGKAGKNGIEIEANDVEGTSQPPAPAHNKKKR